MGKATPIRRGTNPYTRPQLKTRTQNESYSSKNIAKAVGYNRRIRGPQTPITVTYTHVNTPHCHHCKSLPQFEPNPPANR